MRLLPAVKSLNGENSYRSSPVLLETKPQLGRSENVFLYELHVPSMKQASLGRERPMSKDNMFWHINKLVTFELKSK